jgi:hypothetical protein
VNCVIPTGVHSTKKELQEMAISECANWEKVKALTSAITQSCAKYLQKENL